MSPRLDDPKAMLVLWCQHRDLPPPAFIARKAAEGAVEVIGSLTLGGERYVRASHTAVRKNEAELEVCRDLFVQVQAAAGPIQLPGPVPRRRETQPERHARQALERQAVSERAEAEAVARLAQARVDRETLDREARRQEAFVFITAKRARGRWTAQGFFQLGRTQTAAGPFEGSTREAAEAWVVTYLLRACALARSGR